MEKMTWLVLSAMIIALAALTVVFWNVFRLMNLKANPFDEVEPFDRE